MSSTYSHSETNLDHKALKKPDSLMTALNRFFDQLFKSSRNLAILGAVLLLFIGAGSFFMSHRESKTAQARNALFLAEKSLEKELKALATLYAPKPTASLSPAQAAPRVESVLYKKVDVSTHFPETVKKLKEIIESYSGTRAAYEAQLTLGALYYDHGNPTEALNWFVRALSNAPSTLERATTQLAVGHAQEDLANYPVALQDYEAAIKTDHPAVKGDALLSMARVHELLKDTQKAKGVYDQIISQMAGTEYAKTAEIRKSQLE